MGDSFREIKRSDRINEQLSGKIWLAQTPGEWPVTILQNEEQVITHLRAYKGDRVWAYELTPLQETRLVQPEPYIEGVPAKSEEEDHNG